MKKSILVYAALLTTTLFWGLSYIGTKIALKGFSVYSLVMTRFFLASLFYAGLFLIKGFPRFKTVDHIKVIITSFFFPFSYFYLETLALKYTTAGEAALIAAIIPMIVLILAVFFLKEKLSLIPVLGVLFSFIGIGFLILGNISGIELKGNLLGNLLMLGSVLSASIYMVMTRSLGKKYSPVHITGTQIVYGTICFALLCLINFKKLDLSKTVHNLVPESVIAVVLLALLSTILSFYTYNYALTKISAARASIFINGVPVVTAVSACFFLNEYLTPLQAVGGIIVIISVTVANIKKNESGSSTAGKKVSLEKY